MNANMKTIDESAGQFRVGHLRALVVAAMLVALAAATPAQAARRADATADAASRTTLKSYHFSNIPVRSALQLLADEGNFNLVVSDSVQGNITLHLEDVTWEQVLAIVLRLNGLEQHIDGDTRSVSAGG
jgi:type II secretory pathway component HofQ